MIHHYTGWEIEGVGGYCTVRRFVAHKGEQAFWQFKLGEVKQVIDRVEAGEPLTHLDALYRTGLYQ